MANASSRLSSPFNLGHRFHLAVLLPPIKMSLMIIVGTPIWEDGKGARPPNLQISKLEDGSSPADANSKGKSYKFCLFCLFYMIYYIICIVILIFFPFFLVICGGN